MIYFIFALFSVFSLHAVSIEDCLLPAKYKLGMHSMPGIDFIYMINLDKRPEKYEQTMNALKPYGIYPYRFSAVNGWKLSVEAIDSLGAQYKAGDPEGPIASVFRHYDDKEYMSFEIMKEEGVSYYCHSMSRGAIGCILSHISIMQDAYNAGYQRIWVMEDDIRVVSDPHELAVLVDQLDQMAPGWDVLFTDNESKGGDGRPAYCGGIRPRPNVKLQPHSYYTQRYNVNPNIMKIGLRFGSYSMIVSRSGIKKILDYFKQYNIYFPYDMDYCFVPDIKLYQCTRDIVSNIPGGISDIGTDK